ncbi:thioredoxin family protein [bacterium]|nr:thioredoxin family protein [bacterium]
MKSKWFKISVAITVMLVVALAVSVGDAVNNKDTKKPAKPAVKQLPKLLDLGATKCVPCKMMVPVLDELKKEYKGQLDVQFIDVWKDPDSAKKYKVQSIPTQIFFDAKGKEIFRHVGYFPKVDIVKAFKDHGVKLKEPAKPKKPAK